MKIEIGMYCYNKTNRKLGIGMIMSFHESNIAYVEYKNWVEFVSIGNLVASDNITDLIKIGDYVNGELVSDVTGDYLRVGEESITKFYLKNNIKSIVTKEQFEENSYAIR